jgi:hypothetical protein
MRRRAWHAFCRFLLTWGAVSALGILLWFGLTRIGQAGPMAWPAFATCIGGAGLMVAVQRLGDRHHRRARARLLAQPGWEYGYCERCRYPLRTLPLKERLVRGLWMYRRECPECGHASW